MVDMKIRNILDELYDLDQFYITEIADIDGEYKLTMDRLLKTETELLKAYLDCKTILDEYQTADIDLHNLSNCHELRKGFRAGAHHVLEMLKPIK